MSNPYLSQINQDLFPTFLCICDKGSISAAADELGLTQPAVSNQIKQLEKDLGHRLFQRTSSGMSLTAIGEQIYPQVKQIQAQVYTLLKEIQHPDEVTGELILYASTSIATHILPPYLAEFSRRYPEVDIRLSSMNSHDVLDEVRKGTLCLGMTEGLKGDRHQKIVPFLEDEIVLVRSPKIALKNTQLETLLTYPLLIREDGSGTLEVLEQSLKTEGLSIHSFKKTYHFNGTEPIKFATIHAMGLAFLSKHTIEKELKRGELVQVPFNLTIKRQFQWVLPQSPLKGVYKSFFGLISQRRPKK